MRYLLSVCLVLSVAACTSSEDRRLGEIEPPVFIEKPIKEATPVVDAQPVPDVPPATQAALQEQIGDRVFFDLDSTTLDEQDIGILRRQAQWLSAHPQLSVVIEGHADERGTREYNLALGERRAQAVKNFLASVGINPRRISTISYGKERPEFLGSNQRAWGLNRRGVTVVR